MPPRTRPGTRREGEAIEVGRLLRRLQAEGDRLNSAVATRQGVNQTDMSALMHIMEADLAGQPLTPTGLQRVLGLSSGATTSVIDRLEAAGHSRRERDTTDRRRVILRYDEGAREVGQRYFVPLAREISEILDGLSDEEAATVHQFLAGVIEVYAGHSARVGRGEHDAVPPA